MLDLELVKAAAWFAVCFAACEALAIIFGVVLAWLYRGLLKRILH